MEDDNSPENFSAPDPDKTAKNTPDLVNQENTLNDMPGVIAQKLAHLGPDEDASELQEKLADLVGEEEAEKMVKQAQAVPDPEQKPGEHIDDASEPEESSGHEKEEEEE